VTIPTLRPYQRDLYDRVHQSWNQGARNTMVVLSTGLGKTVLLSQVIKDHQGLSCVMAHRQELVSQLSMSLARFEVMHRIIAPKNVIASIVREHQIEFGRTYYNANAPAAVAGVNTLVSRQDALSRWAQQVTLWVGDEIHHYLKKNLFGTAASMFPHARGLGVTATPQRADGKGLGAHSDGLFHVMLEGPPMSAAMQMGNLCRYRIVAPPGDFDADHIKITASGDFSGKEMREAARKSHIVGDVVEHYLRFAAGKTGITFATDVETANEIAEQYRQAGVPCQAVSAETPEHVRNDFVRRFKRGDLLQLVNVDLFGEGFDLPNLEVVSMARPTMSLAVYMQQCLDSETEVLTNRGWVGRQDIRYDDMVAAVDVVDMSAHWCGVEGIVDREIDQSERMFSIKSPHLDIRVTGGHDMIVKGISGTCIKWHKQIAADVACRKGMFRVPISAELQIPDADISDNDLRVIGWFLSDGVVNKRTNALMISQASHKKSHCNSIRSVLRSANFRVGECTIRRTGDLAKYEPLLMFSVSHGNPRKVVDRHMTGWARLEKWFDKSLPGIYDTLSARQLGVMLETLNLGDGVNNHKGCRWNRQTMTITCGDNKVMAERLQALLVVRGFKCNLATQHYPGRNRWYILHIKKSSTATIAGIGVSDGNIGDKTYVRSRFSSVEHTPGERVWCVTNRLGTLITRRNGKVSILGNCGRALRPSPGKDRALIIDHVGNVKRHGLPDIPRRWTLDAREKRSSKAADPDVIPLTTCLSCYEVYERIKAACPHCGYKHQPDARRRPDQVDGDLAMLDDDVLEALRQAAIQAMETPESMADRVGFVAGPIAGRGAANRQREKIEAQLALRETIALWAGQQRSLNRPDEESYRRFFLTFGIDVLSAQALGRNEAEKLTVDIQKALG
jgi:superfamily II DNA or RNA helicase